MWTFGMSTQGHRTWNSLYKVLVTVLLFPPVEFVVVWVVDVGGLWVGGGRHVTLFPFAFIRGNVLRREEGTDIRIVSGKKLEL